MFSLTILEEKFDVHGYILVQLNWYRFICNQLLSVGFVPLFVLIIYYWLEEKSFKTFNLQKYSFVSYSVKSIQTNKMIVMAFMWRIKIMQVLYKWLNAIFFQ